MELVNQLMQNLGINEDQAKAGAGSIFELAKDKLSGDEFKQLTGATPEVSDLLKFAPKSESPVGAIADMATDLGGGLGKLGGLASLAGNFSKIGLDSGLIGKFVPIVLSFIGSKGGNPLKDILAKVLK